MDYMSQGNKIIGLVIGLAITLAILSSAFLPQLVGWSSSLSSVNGTSYSWVIGIITLVVIFGVVIWAINSARSKQ